jgi:RNA polymerase sigma-70 factor (ECF subfamily)
VEDIFSKNKSEKEESELLQQFQSTGNLEILGELYNIYIHLVYGVCLKYLNNRDESKDAVSKIFEILIIEIPKFEIQNFKSWLYVVTKNYCLMEIRKKKTEKKHLQVYTEEIFMESSEILHPIDEVPESNLAEELKNCIEKLKQEQQECIIMFYYDKKCYKEISDKLKIEQSKVKSYIQNGKRNLKICLELTTSGIEN